MNLWHDIDIDFDHFSFTGGDTDNASKGIVGVSLEKKSLLIVVRMRLFFQCFMNIGNGSQIM